MMEWSYEYVVRWTIRNLNIGDIIAARLRGEFDRLGDVRFWVHFSPDVI